MSGARGSVTALSVTPVQGLRITAREGWIGPDRVRENRRVYLIEESARLVNGKRHADPPTLDLLRGYRGGLDTTEPLAFGVYGSVVEPGRVRVGDAVAPQR
jgi:hypothetical protein